MPAYNYITKGVDDSVNGYMGYIYREVFQVHNLIDEDSKHLEGKPSSYDPLVYLNEISGADVRQAFNADKTVGVIVPYRNQIAMIRKEIERLNLPGLDGISIDTVERYQGSQRDVIIYSFTVQRQYQLSFLTANTFEEAGHLIDRKLNVALTRARKQLILTGNPRTLAANAVFSQLMGYIRSKGGYNG